MFNHFRRNAAGGGRILVVDRRSSPQTEVQQVKHTLSFATAGFVLTSGLILTAGLTMAQAPVQAPPAYPNYQTPPTNQAAPPTSLQSQLTPQLLGEMLRSATTFHELVRSMNLSQSLGPDPHYIGADGKVHHSLERTAETIGAGAGAGAAVGAMSHNPNGVMIGALIGGAGGLIIDQILKQHEQQQAQAIAAPAPDSHYTPPAHREFKTRDDDRRVN
jgi:hypothetical protein